MAHPATPEAVGAPATISMADAAAEFDDFGPGENPGEETTDESEIEAEEGDDIELDDEGEAEEADEPETAIEAPASLNAEEKKVFAQLPPEAQQVWAASETRRNTQVQEATTNAAERERAAETKAAQAEAAAEQKRAAQLKAFIEPFRPQMPNPQLAYSDPASYIAAKAQYDAEVAQFTEWEQHIEGIGTQAQQQAEQIDLQARMADLMTLGKLADPATREEYLKTSLTLVEELGLDPMAFENVASSTDFKALDKIAEWKAKAEKLDAAMSRKMSKVRSARGKTLRPGAAQAEASGAERISHKAMDAFRKNPSDRRVQAAIFENI